MVRGLAGQGVHFVKMWVNKMPEPGLKITPEIRAAIVDEAMKQDLVPVAHIDEEADVRQLIDVGVRDFLHTVTDTEVGEEFLQLCLDNGVTFSPTLTNTHSLSIWAEHPELLEDPEIHASFEPESYAKWIDPAYREEWMAQPSFEARKIRLHGLKAFVKTVVDAGIPVAVGTDNGASTWNVPMGWGTPPRVGAVRRGRVNADASNRRRHPQWGRADIEGRAGVRHLGGRHGGGPDCAERRSADRHSEHPGDRPRHAAR